MWKQKSPVAFQLFNNLNFNKKIAFPQKFDSRIYYEFATFDEERQTKYKAATHTLYPIHNTIGERLCTVMRIMNLAETEWINVKCHTKAIVDVICVTFELQNSSDVDQMELSHESQYCDSNEVLLDESCLLFLWHSRNKTSIKNKIGGKAVRNILRIKILIDAISSSFPPVLTPVTQNLKLFKQIHVKKHLYNFELTTSNKSFAESEGLLVLEKITETIQTTSPQAYLYNCSQGGFVSVIFLCDGVPDCPNDKSDEAHCRCNWTAEETRASMKVVPHLCREIVSPTSTGVLCGPLHLLSHQHSCEKYLLYSQDIQDKFKNKYFLQEQSAMLKNDLIFDQDVFSSESDDESDLIALLTYGTEKNCTEPHQMACKKGHSKCVNVSQICLYQLNKQNHIYPCRNGGNLENCRYFQCNKRYKCQSSYCIPWSQVCNGVIDCPENDDEEYQPICGREGGTICYFMYKCHTYTICVHQQNVCDGTVDCPGGDDEVLCAVYSMVCPTGCNCIASAILCIEVTLNTTFSHLYFGFFAVFVENSNVTRISFVLQKFPSVSYIRIVSCGMLGFCKVSVPESLLNFHLENNNITKVISKCMISTRNVKVLSLTKSNISVVESKAFLNTTFLQVLNLTGNCLLNLPESIVTEAQSLKVISFPGLLFKDIEPKAFHDINVKIIETSDYRICCISPKESTCTVEIPWHVSCLDLLMNDNVRASYGCVTFLVGTTNLLSIFLHFQTMENKKKSGKQMEQKRNKRSFVATVISVNVNDFVSVTYFAIIFFADLYYAGHFVTKEQSWNSSILCFVASGFLQNFLTLTQALLLFLSVSRLMLVVSPIDTNFKRTKFVLCWVFGFVILSFCSALTISLTFYFLVAKLPISLCLFYIDPTKTVAMATILTWVISVSQTVTSISIVILHILLIYNLLKSQKNVQMAKSGEDSNLVLFVQLLLITLSNLLCWLPANSVFIAASFLPAYPTQMIVWTVALAMPFNSVVNPCVFLFMCLKKIHKNYKDEN